MQKLPLKLKSKMKPLRGGNGVTLMELVVAMALFAIISTFAVTMALSVNAKTNSGIGTVGAANEMKRAERLIENWFYSNGSGNNMRCVNVADGTPDSPVTPAPATTAAPTTAAATAAAAETNPTAATTVQSGTLLDWSTVSADGDKLKISGTQQGCIQGSDLNTSIDGWVSYKSTSAKNKNNFYFWGFPTEYSSHTGFRFKAYASKKGAVLYYGDQNVGNKQKHVTLSDSPSDYYYIESSFLNGTDGNITFYPEESGVTIYIRDIEWYDEVTVTPTTAATTAAAETDPTAATTIKSGTLLDWSIVTYDSGDLKISGSGVGYSGGSEFNNTSDGWVSYKSTIADKKENLYFWGFPSGYSSHTGFRFKAYASEDVTLNCGSKDNGSMRKQIPLSTVKPSHYYYIETSFLNGTGGNITFYPNKAGVTIYISDIEWYDEVEVTTTTAATTAAATTTTDNTETTSATPLLPIDIDIYNGVIVIMNSGSSNEAYLVFDKDNMTVSCGNQYESEQLVLKKSQVLQISTNGTLLKLVFDTPDFPFKKRVMLFAKRTTD